MLPPDVRYLRDATFAALVNILEYAMRSCSLAPTDLHEAVTLAASFHERYRARQIQEPALVCMDREEDELKARMNIQGLGLLSLQDKEKPVGE